MLQPINKLPPEIISYIARSVIGKNDEHPGSIVPLTNVCRYWRGAIISTPENWTLIYSEQRGLAKLSLERAKAARLVVSLLFPLKEEFINLLLPRIHNIVSLSCDGFYPAGELVQLFPNFPRSMPLLRSLVLDIGTGPRGQVDPVQADPFDFSTVTMLTELSLSFVPLLPSIRALRTLTKLTLFDRHFRVHVDTLLSFLEENRSLENASLTIEFKDPSLCLSERRSPIETGLRDLSITGYDVIGVRALTSGIALQKGATLTLDIYRCGEDAGLTKIFSGVPATHLSNVLFPTFMEYRHSPRRIRLLGPDGSFSYEGRDDSEIPFEEFAVLSLAGIRELRLDCTGSWILAHFRLSFFPALEVLAIDSGSSLSFLSPELPGSENSPLLRTLAFLDFSITEDFMATLTQIAIHREQNMLTSPLRRISIVNNRWQFVPYTTVEYLMKHVSVVEVVKGAKFPEDLS